MSATQPNLKDKKGEPKQIRDPYTSNAPSKNKQMSNAYRKSSHAENFYYKQEFYSSKFDMSTTEPSSKPKNNSIYNSQYEKLDVDPFLYSDKTANCQDGSLNQGLSNHITSYEFYRKFLEKIKNTQNLVFDKDVSNYFNLDAKPARFNQHKPQEHVLSESTEPNHLLNESISTTNSAHATAIHSPKKALSRQTIKMIYDGYLELNYPEIHNIQQKFSTPYTNIDAKKNSIYFVIKSFNIENIHKAIKYGVWSTTYSGNIIFDKAYSLAQSRNAEVYLFFSTNSTFAFQGIARLKSKFQTKTYSFWKGSEKYKSFNGSFNLDWLIIKDVPNSTLDKIQVNNIPFSKLRNGVELNEKDALNAVNIFRNFYYCSSLVLSDFMRLDMEEKSHSQS